MKPYSPATNKGRSAAMDIFQNRLAGDTLFRCTVAKTMRHAARQQARQMVIEGLADAV